MKILFFSAFTFNLTKRKSVAFSVCIVLLTICKASWKKENLPGLKTISEKIEEN
jgi:hypothetical protein